MFGPVIEAVTPPGVPSGLSGVLEFEHWSKNGSASPIIVPLRDVAASFRRARSAPLVCR